MISLPAEWPGLRSDGTLSAEFIEESANGWPMHWLKRIAAQCHLERQEAGAGQIIHTAADDITPHALWMTGMGMFPSRLHPRARHCMPHDDMSIEFLALWPLHPQEVTCARRDGAEALLARLEQAGVTDLIDPARHSVAGR
jgi:hypothetical protein